ncbi:hypothetical protein F0U44_10440 [Nocardioides humilatus]|uniref:Uncharacterized protein n=1 Tax=Nocardioides humilatus TaxID=2607660 RepID=A0A5B1LGY4_9ACTN|nr:hypothetical protein [Nocardioides humilatus]KAA1418887.1 hypothetical protein F0U44_10440 [Nocardioides humilatus]
MALAAVIAVVRRAWFAIVPGGAEAPASFAPPARRPAPGATALAVGPPTPITARDSHPVAAAFIVGGLAWFAIGIIGMHGFGWFQWAEASLLTDTAFHVSGLWAAAIGGLALAVRA